MRQAHELRLDQFVHLMKVLRQFTALTHLTLVVHDDKYRIITGGSYADSEIGVGQMSLSIAEVDREDMEELIRKPISER
jgi:hypothetical protein